PENASPGRSSCGRACGWGKAKPEINELRMKRGLTTDKIAREYRARMQAASKQGIRISNPCFIRG
ncbi:MAG TPA: hypothetical protein VHB99_14510, partial [Pirellulales bacterium]|nr:hypothetical protein [Pirellulales bacterium]